MRPTRRRWVDGLGAASIVTMRLIGGFNATAPVTAEGSESEVVTALAGNVGLTTDQLENDTDSGFVALRVQCGRPISVLAGTDLPPGNVEIMFQDQAWLPLDGAAPDEDPATFRFASLLLNTAATALAESSCATASSRRLIVGAVLASLAMTMTMLTTGVRIGRGADRPGTVDRPA